MRNRYHSQAPYTVSTETEEGYVLKVGERQGRKVSKYNQYGWRPNVFRYSDEEVFAMAKVSSAHCLSQRPDKRGTADAWHHLDRIYCDAYMRGYEEGIDKLQVKWDKEHKHG